MPDFSTQIEFLFSHPGLLIFTSYFYGCDMAGSNSSRSWWDRDVDPSGQPLRADVRLAAHKIWDDALRLVQKETGDTAQAAELMESSVARVSRYLNRKSILLFSRRIEGLLMLTFQRAIRRSVSKLRRFEPRGGIGDLSMQLVDRSWGHQTEVRLDFERVASYLREENRQILALWYAGYRWPEIATLLGSTPAVIRNKFWRDVHSAKTKLGRIKLQLDGTNSAD